MSTIRDIEQLFFKSTSPVKVLETEYPCILCKINNRCYYKKDVMYTWDIPYYICQTSHKQIIQFGTKVMLIHYLCENKLVYDLKQIIIYMLCFNNEYDTINCVNEKLSIMQYRMNYINIIYLLQSYTINKLKEVITSRNLKMPKGKHKQHYINVISHDINNKHHIWIYDKYGV